MSINPKNIVRHEIIGLKAKVVHSNQKSYVGIRGRIVDETKNMVVIEKNGEEKMIEKKTTIFHIKLPNDLTVEVDGKLLVGRPEDRTQKRF